MPPTGCRDDAANGSDPGTAEPAAAHRRGPSTPADPATRTGREHTAASPLRTSVLADTVAPSLVRDQVRAWLTTYAWPRDRIEDVVLAVSEAVSNSVEHAYADEPAGLIELQATVHQGRLQVVLRDHGRWRPAPADDEGRRRGIPLMRACMDTVLIEPLADEDGLPAGTRVTLAGGPSRTW